MRLELDRLEIARGHDGLLQGAPEPVVAIGLYVVEQGATRLAQRALWRFAAPLSFPAAVAPVAASRLKGGRLPASAAGWALLAIALEEDGKADVGRLFAALERPAALHLLLDDGSGETDLERLRDLEQAHAPRAVHVLLDGEDAAASCRSDEWVGAAAVALPVKPVKQTLRLHFSTGDRRNDWTAVLDVGY